MTPSPRPSGWIRWTTAGRWKKFVALAAAWPVCQATGCFPDPIGALNFELQSLINSVLINLVSVVVANLLGL
jgi:hypothetical protein